MWLIPCSSRSWSAASASRSGVSQSAAAPKITLRAVVSGGPERALLDHPDTLRSATGLRENEDAGRGLPRIGPGRREIDLRGMRKILSASSSASPSSVVPAVSQAATQARARGQRAAGARPPQRDPPAARPEHLTASTPLRSAARFHSTDMLQNGYFEHDSQNEAWDARVSRYLKSTLDRREHRLGQRLDTARPRASSASGCTPPPHRAIILTPGLHRVGLGIATGTFDGTPGAVHGHRRLRCLSDAAGRHREGPRARGRARGSLAASPRDAYSSARHPPVSVPHASSGA